MKIVKITTKENQTFFCEPGTRVQVDNHNRIKEWEYIEMSKEEFTSIPATNESSDFFA